LPRQSTARRSAARLQLQQAGIPGIKYLDQGSRTAGDGSRNYVVFDDRIISIVRKYGIAALLGSGVISQQMADALRQQGIDKGA
jgi:rhodanese-related sulfurtransferase